MKSEKIRELSRRKYHKLQSSIEGLTFGIKLNSKLNCLFPNDLIDLSIFYKTVSDGTYVKAYFLLRNMDTSVYEFIPDSIYNFISYGEY